MTCKKVKVLLSLHLDGMVSGKALKKLEEHLSRCIACQAEWQALRRLRQVFDGEAPKKLEADVFTLIEQRLTEQPVRTGWLRGALSGWRRWAIAFAAPVLLAAAFWGWKVTSTSTPPAEATAPYEQVHLLTAYEIGLLGDASLMLTAVELSHEQTE